MALSRTASADAYSADRYQIAPLRGGVKGDRGDRRSRYQCATTTLPAGGNAGLVCVPRNSASAVCSALSSLASLGT